MKEWPNQITGAKADGPCQLPIRTRWAARGAQFRRWTAQCTPEMTKLTLKLCAVALLATGGVAAGLFIATPRPDVSVSFVGYTNDVQRFRAEWYRIPDNSAHAMAVFRLSNRSLKTFAYRIGRVELNQAGSWKHDTNQLPLAYSALPVLSARGSEVFEVATPPGSSVFRCSVEVTELRPSVRGELPGPSCLARGL